MKDNLKKIPIPAKVPIFSIPDTPLVKSTQEFIPLSDITDDMILYKDGGAAIILETTSLNFGLLSGKEQEAVVAAYGALINSLSFSVQIMVRSSKKDLTNYLKYMEENFDKNAHPRLKVLMEGYKNFITETVKKKNVLSKRFFIVIPFSPLELGVQKSAASLIRKSATLPFPKSYVMKKAKAALFPKRDHLIRQIGRLGIKLRQLSNVELVELMYTTYNPVVPVTKTSSQEPVDNSQQLK